MINFIPCAGCNCVAVTSTLPSGAYITFNEGEPDEETIVFCSEACRDAAAARGHLLNGRAFAKLGHDWTGRCAWSLGGHKDAERRRNPLTRFLRAASAPDGHFGRGSGSKKQTHSQKPEKFRVGFPSGFLDVPPQRLIPPPVEVVARYRRWSTRAAGNNDRARCDSPFHARAHSVSCRPWNRARMRSDSRETSSRVVKCADQARRLPTIKISSWSVFE
jgi:hypothetical protein